MVEILGILNVTADSFSDGGRFLEPAAALTHARALRAAGADWIDVGAESTHPDAADVPAELEVARLTPVVTALVAEGMQVSVDTRKPAVMRAVLGLGVQMLNDVHGLRDAESIAAVRDSGARLIVMHNRAPRGRAQRAAASPEDIVGDVEAFLRERLATLTGAGIARERIILDPGMGFFLSPRVDDSIAVLRALPRLAACGAPLCVSVSRKSFVGALLGSPAAPRPVGQRGAGTLAAELWAAAQPGVRYIRTHDVAALRDGLRVWEALVSRMQIGCGQ
jgi:dihydropteroate synthase type 2